MTFHVAPADRDERRESLKRRVQAVEQAAVERGQELQTRDTLELAHRHSHAVHRGWAFSGEVVWENDVFCMRRRTS